MAMVLGSFPRRDSERILTVHEIQSGFAVRGMTATLYSLHVYLLLAGGLLGLLDLALQAAVGSDALLGLRLTHGPLWALSTLVLVFLMGLSPVLSCRRYGPVVVLPLLATLVVPLWGLRFLAGLPISELIVITPARLWEHTPWPHLLDLGASVFTLAIAAWALGDIRRRSAPAWMLPPTQLRPHVTRGPRILAFLGLGLPLLVAGTAAYLVACALAAVDALGGGFMAIAPDRLEMVEKTYVRGRVRVSLVGMMHIGRPDFYRGILSPVAGERTALLQEGVTDARKLLEHRLDYSRVAARLGLGAQGEHFRPDPEQIDVIPADLDVADFSPSTQRILEALARVFGRNGADAAALLDLQRHFERPEDLQNLLRDILDRRNALVLARLAEVAPRYDRVIIPWGALHLPGIEKALREQGYAHMASRRHTVVRWAEIPR